MPNFVAHAAPTMNDEHPPVDGGVMFAAVMDMRDANESVMRVIENLRGRSNQDTFSGYFFNRQTEAILLRIAAETTLAVEQLGDINYHMHYANQPPVPGSGDVGTASRE